jgi:hypothetical protein
MKNEPIPAAGAYLIAGEAKNGKDWTQVEQVYIMSGNTRICRWMKSSKRWFSLCKKENLNAAVCAVKPRQTNTI